MSAGKRVLITGAASGIGAGTVAALRARGAQVAGLDVNATDTQSPSGSGTGRIIACDVRDQASVDAGVAEAIERLGGLDVVINCAGIGDPQSAADRPGEDAERVLAVNLMGPWRITAAAMPALLESSRGRVVNVASGLAHISMPFATAYCMSKRGVVAYSDALRAEFGDVIDVTTVYPGYIRTPIHDASAEKGIQLEGMVPPEPLESAVAAMVRAALDEKPPRDLATTRSGTVNYAALRLIPRRWVDAGMRRQLRRAARKGSIRSEGIAADLHRRLTAKA